MKKGFTIVEVLVALSLFTIILAIAVGGFANALHAQREAALLIAAQSNASIALEQMAREIRTGYHFCVGAKCGSSVCTSDGNRETCTLLDFVNAEGSGIQYSLANGALVRNAGGGNGAAEPLTSGNVTVKYLIFTLYGNAINDLKDPRITISMGIAPSSTDPALAGNVINLETTVSARTCGTLVNDC